MRYQLTFYGRRVGAIGLRYRITATREAATREAAILALYDEWEHINVVQVEELGDRGTV